MRSLKTDSFLSGLRHSSSALLREGMEALSSSGGSVFAVMAALVCLILKGLCDPGTLCRVAGISESNLAEWVRTADEEGFDGLTGESGSESSGEHGILVPQRLLNLLRAVRPVRGNGRLSEQQRTEVREALRNPPEEYGYRVWDGPSLSDFIAVRYRIICSVRECVRILREAGL